MINFIPTNRHILIQKRNIQKEEDSVVLLPDGYKPRSDEYVKVKILKIADGCNIEALPGDDLVVREAFIEELSLDGKALYLILENHVMGVIENEEDIE